MAQRKDERMNKWYFYGKYKENGKYINYKKRGFNTKREAIVAEREFLNNLKEKKEKVKFCDLVEMFLDYLAPKSKKSTLKNDEYTLKKWIDNFGDMYVDNMNRVLLQDWFDDLDTNFSKRYCEKIYYVGNKLFKWGVFCDKIEKNPLEKVRLNERPNEFKKEMLFWERDEFEKFIDTVDDLMWKAFFGTLFYMGVRRGEAMALTWNDVDLSSKTMRIEKTTSGINRSCKEKVTPPKTKNSYRTITMPDVLVGYLKAWLQEEKKYPFFKKSESFIFGCELPLAPETVRRTFLKYIKETNSNLPMSEKIPTIRIHDLRHSHASYLINNMSEGFTDFDIAKRLGDTVETLHSTYAHWFKRKDENIIDFMNRDSKNVDNEDDLRTFLLLANKFGLQISKNI